jgi:hypothetical protein
VSASPRFIRTQLATFVVRGVDGTAGLLKVTNSPSNAIAESLGNPLVALDSTSYQSEFWDESLSFSAIYLDSALDSLKGLGIEHPSHIVTINF